MDISTLYSLRQKFTIIAITGRTGSGCTKVTKMFANGFVNDPSIYPVPSEFTTMHMHNSYRKYRIIYEYAKVNFKKYKVINYVDLVIALTLKNSFDDFIKFLNSGELKNEFEKTGLTFGLNSDNEVKLLKQFENEYNEIHVHINEVFSFEGKPSDKDLQKLYELFESTKFKNLVNSILSSLKATSQLKKLKILSVIASNLRKTGTAFHTEDESINNCFTIVKVLNYYIKSVRLNSGKDSNTEIIINSMRNPLELMFFKQRLAAFYVVAINRADSERKKALESRFRDEDKLEIDKLLNDEYNPARANIFHKQNVAQCIQLSDIHITYRTVEESTKLNEVRKNLNDFTSPFFSVGMQILKYVSLIDHPGLITPSPEERSMQLAYTAKLNSGCISRQVGATITDEHYSVRAIGWNNTPEGQVPCNLRNVTDLLDNKDPSAFTPYEKSQNFIALIEKNYKNEINKCKQDLKGRNVCFCFKSIYNSEFEGKNQVHTRSLHAEENAFLQIAKYGGSGIQGGKLFTTASPCELCAKKAYQLGIKVIYYIDPYPGISKDQILEAGRKEKNPELRLFNGAIGNAYHWLYESFMAYKDELTLILEKEIIDLTKKLKSKNELLEEDNKKLTNEIQHLKSMAQFGNSSGNLF